MNVVPLNTVMVGKLSEGECSYLLRFLSTRGWSILLKELHASLVWVQWEALRRFVHLQIKAEKSMPAFIDEKWEGGHASVHDKGVLLDLERSNFRTVERLERVVSPHEARVYAMRILQAAAEFEAAQEGAA